MIVMKFGGTSNEDATAMRNVLRIVNAHLKEQPVVVISAIAQCTNELEETVRLASRGNEDEAVSLVTRLFERHNRIADNLISSRPLSSQLEEEFYQYLGEIKSLIKGVSILRELTRRTIDAVCSYGERLSSKIIAAGLQESGVNAVWTDAKDFMVTDDNFGRAHPLMDKVTVNLERIVRPLLNQGKTPVTQGFIGVTLSGAYTTMGRESSDYSAAIIGAAMDADRVQIWTDVDGILTADPRVVKTTSSISRMTFEEAFELSYFGAKVLHPNTMLPVLEKGIPVEILNSKNAAVGGTVICREGVESKEQGLPKSIAYRKGMAVVTVAPLTREGQYLFWEQILNVLTASGVTARMMATSEYGISLAVEEKETTKTLLDALRKFGAVEVHRRKASVCIVGNGVRGSAGFTARVFEALSEMKILMISFGASPANISLILDESDVSNAVNRLHDEFFDNASV